MQRNDVVTATITTGNGGQYDASALTVADNRGRSSGPHRLRRPERLAAGIEPLGGQLWHVGTALGVGRQWV